MAGALILLVYVVGMLYGIIGLVSLWTSGRERTSGFLFLALGVVVPVAAWAVGIAVPQAALGVPLSLGLLAALLSKRIAVENVAQNRLGDEDLEAVDRRLAQEPGDGAALEMRAQLLERRGAYLAALQDYEAAHRASDRNLPEHELEHVRRRLLDLAVRTEAGKNAPEPGAGLWAGLDYAWLVAGACMFAADLMRGFVLTSLFAFLCWIRRQDLGGS